MRMTNQIRRRRTNRRLGSESLEARQLLTTVAYDYPLMTDYTVFADSAANAIEVHDNSVGYHDDIFHGPSPRSGEGPISFSQPEHGEVVRGEGGDLLYTPASGYQGHDQFVYTTTGYYGSTYDVTVSLRVVHPFVAVPDWTLLAAGENETVEIDVLANDQWNVSGGYGRPAIVDQQPSPDLSIIAVTECSHGGTVAISDDGQTVLYTPADGFEGLDEFSYTVVDADGHRRDAVAQVRITSDSTDPSDAPHFRWHDEFVYEMISRQWRRTIPVISSCSTGR